MRAKILFGMTYYADHGFPNREGSVKFSWNFR
jgi:hypothetical protein